MYCSRCGAANPEGVDVRYCRSCGADLAHLAPPAGQVYPPPQAPPGVVAPGAGPPAFLGGQLQAAVFPYGGFWIRLVAYFLDGLMVTVMTFVVGDGLGVVVGALGGSEDAASLLGGLAAIFITMAYWAASPPIWGATPGKVAVGYHIVAEDGRHIGLGRAVARYLGYFASTLPVGLGFLWIGLDARKQGWHDKIAGTFVVRKEFVKP